MKKVLDNLKPFIIYFISILIYFALDYFKITNVISPLVATTCAFVIYFVLTTLFAYSTEFKKSKYGVIAFVIMLAISPIVYAILNHTYFALMIGNAFFIDWLPEIIPFEYDVLLEPFYMIFYYFLGVVVPAIPFALGYGIKRLINKKKPAAI